MAASKTIFVGKIGHSPNEFKKKALLQAKARVLSQNVANDLPAALNFLFFKYLQKAFTQIKSSCALQ